MSSTINSINSASTTAGLGKSSSVNSADAQSDRFLKLLVAQLNNQDPLNPMDNAQMTSQMAQINTVSGIQQVNDSIKSMAAQFSSLQMLQASPMVGRDVLSAGNTMSTEGGIAKGGFNLAAAADQVSVQVLSPGGQLLDTLQLGRQPAGQQSFTWDASNNTDLSSVTFKVVATNGSAAVDATPLSRNTVTAVSLQNGALTVQLKGNASVAYDQIQSIL